MRITLKRGITLIETLLYVAIISILFTAFTFLLLTFLRARIKNQVISNIDQQSVLVIHEITQAIRNAETITSPAVGSPSSTLILDALSVGVDPTRFDVANGVLRIQEGAGSAVALTNNRVEVTDLTFSNLTAGSSPGIIQIELTLSSANPSGRNEYEYTKTATTSAALRHP